MGASLLHTLISLPDPPAAENFVAVIDNRGLSGSQRKLLFFKRDMDCAGLPALCAPKLASVICGASSARKSGGKPPHSK